MQLPDPVSASASSKTPLTPIAPRARTMWLRGALPILLVAWWLTVPASASLGYCSQTCELDSSCNQPCLVNYDDPSTCGQYGTCWSSGYCGDGFCANRDGEDVTTCSADCFIGPGSTPPANAPTCGNAICETGESNRNCSADCSHNNPTVCGDGICEIGETFNNCTADCIYTDWCNGSQFICDTGYSCRANRCVYDPMAQSCLGSNLGTDCSGSNERCTQVDPSTGYGICVPFF